MRVLRADDAYVTYRYAKNLAHGNGFVFNIGEQVLGTTAPLHGLILTPFALFTDDLATVANVISYVSAFVLALAMLLILESVRLQSAGMIAATGIALTTQTYLFAPLETILAAMLCWLLILFYITDRWLLMSICGALACLVRPDSALLLALIYLWYLVEHRRIVHLIKHGLITLLVASPWLVWAWLTYGSPLPATVQAKSGWKGHLTTFLGDAWGKVLKDLLLGSRLVSGLLVVLALLGCWCLLVDHSYRRLTIVPAWLLAYGAAYTLIRIPYSFSWYYYPFVCGVFFLSSVGLVWLARSAGSWLRRIHLVDRVMPTAIGLFTTVLVLAQVRYSYLEAQTLPQQKWSGPRDELYSRVGKWFAANTPPGTSAAMCEVGAIAYYSNIRVIDLWGLVTPAVVEHIKKGDYEWAIENYKPDFVVSHYRGKGSPPGPSQWLNRSYASYELVESFENDAYPYVLDLYRRIPKPAP